MIVALIDNGSLEPAAHQNLRSVAAALSQRAGIAVHAVSWKHSDRIALGSAGGPPAFSASGQATRGPNASTPAWTLAPFIRAMVALGQREFIFVPFFISAQGAIGSALRSTLESLQRELGPDSFEFSFTAGLAARGAIAGIVADRIRAMIAAQKLRTPPVILVDHGGPSAASATLRDDLAVQLRQLLDGEIGPLATASMEGAHPPLLADRLRAPELAGRDVVIALLFLSPGRHAGPEGDVAQICRTAAIAGTRTHLTDLVGTHPAAIEALASALRDTLSTVHVQPSA